MLPARPLASLTRLEFLPFQEKREEYAAGYMGKACAAIEAKCREGFLFGERLSNADLAVSMLVNMIVTDDWDHIPASWMDTYPKMKALNERVRADKLVLEYFKHYKD